MALSKLFLLKDKRLENLLVLAYNPSHMNVNNGTIKYFYFYLKLYDK